MATITVPPDLLAEADRVARQDGISVDDLIADAVRQRLKQHRREQFEAEARACPLWSNTRLLPTGN